MQEITVSKSTMPEIMCTLTIDQIHNDDHVRAMYEAGMTSVRINTAHLNGVKELQTLSSHLKEKYPNIKILIDTKGPEMRTTSNANSNPITLIEGNRIEIHGSSDDSPSTLNNIFVNYPAIHTEVKTDDTLLIDDGKLILKVTDVEGQTIHATVTKGGELRSRQGVAVAGVDLNLPAVSEHDREYINFASTSPYIDVIAHSFVRSANDVIEVKKCLNGHAKPIIAKIENQQGIDNLTEIIDSAEGILIARGDLTASIGKQNIAAAQSYIAAIVAASTLPLYLATNILPSLMTAENVSDEDIRGISIAIRQGVDVMLLTNETASGPHPIQSVKALKHAIDMSK